VIGNGMVEELCCKTTRKAKCRTNCPSEGEGGRWSAILINTPFAWLEPDSPIFCIAANASIWAIGATTPKFRNLSWCGSRFPIDPYRFSSAVTGNPQLSLCRVFVVSDP
jgi:hypothetical protein